MNETFGQLPKDHSQVLREDFDKFKADIEAQAEAIQEKAGPDYDTLTEMKDVSESIADERRLVRIQYETILTTAGHYVEEELMKPLEEIDIPLLRHLRTVIHAMNKSIMETEDQLTYFDQMKQEINEKISTIMKRVEESVQHQ